MPCCAPLWIFDTVILISLFPIVKVQGAACSVVTLTGTPTKTTDVTGFEIYKFTSTGSIKFSAATNVTVLVVGGGGSGSTHVGGGGGAGAVIYYPVATLTAGTTYAVTVGLGGVHNNTTQQVGVNGKDSAIGTMFVAKGGGGGGCWTCKSNTVRSGGSGGGSGPCRTSGDTSCTTTSYGQPVATNVVNSDWGQD
jgi:hypothetical protein